MIARFKISGLGPIFDGEREATVEIDRARSTFAVRPLRRREVHTLPLAEVAVMVLWKFARREKIRRAAP